LTELSTMAHLNDAFLTSPTPTIASKATLSHDGRHTTPIVEHARNHGRYTYTVSTSLHNNTTINATKSPSTHPIWKRSPTSNPLVEL
jgi:hypothetical protein